MVSVALFVAVFLACSVEAVEALTILLAAGATRRWRSALIGAAVAIVTLAVIVVVLSPAISAIPIAYLRLLVGVMLTGFGIFRGAEGAGVTWPGADAALLVLIPAVLVVFLLYVRLLTPRTARIRDMAVEEVE